MQSRSLRSRKRQIDLLLLSVIRAYQHPDSKSEVERLAMAREALFGEKRGRGRANIFDDIAVFLIQAELRKREVEGLARAGKKIGQT